MRLDKLLANTGYGSRKEVKTLLKKRLVTVNSLIITDGKLHVEPNVDDIKVDGQSVSYQKNIYLMLNKPQGVISATVDDEARTVIDLLPSSMQRFKPFPVGRLDKNTEGLLLLTNDGQLAHRLLSPKKDVGKTYIATIQGKVTIEDVDKFKNGIVLEDGYKTKPARLKILKSDEESKVEITITEGKFHQIKRMFRSVEKRVIYLKRVSMGKLTLDPSLPLGHYRELNEAEIAYCHSL
ncbi:pseudouridine synthase [Virgibacillus sp. MG-45]|uniref:pseudouridine synthase n=1 Tax=Virgibacillus sp. MG-45 TaxID=3102791 RepID=UPI002EDA3C26